MSKLQYDDPVYRNTLREAGLIIVLWVLAFIWVVCYSWWAGYGSQDPNDLKLILGMPDWVFWGIAFPWAACTLITIVFSQWVIADDKLDAVSPPAHESAGQTTEETL